MLDDNMLLDQAGQIGPAKKAAKPTARRKATRPQAKAAPKTQASKTKCDQTTKPAKPKGAQKKAKPEAPKTPSPAKSKPAAKVEPVVPKMTRKCVTSRAYHKELQESKKAGLPEDEAKERAREAYNQAGNEYDRDDKV